MSINANIDISQQHYINSELADSGIVNSCVAATIPNMKPWYMEVIDDLHNEGVIDDNELLSVYTNHGIDC